MANDTNTRTGGDRVNVSRPHEFRYWMEFGCTADQIQKAVRAMGTSAQHARRSGHRRSPSNR